ncbi:uncharacterized protein ABDE67_019935 [Symphorus nematophorus]
MAAANYLPSEDQFLCSICLHVFTDPVTTPCGHNFCKDCITQHWSTTENWKCPICAKVFQIKPELRVNTFISEMVAQFRQSAQQEASNSSSEQQVTKPGEVPCDVCTGTKLKAMKSCLDCLVSYCETHLEPHLTTSGLKRHQLIDPVENLEDRMCVKHDKPLELFCKTDQTCVCMLCSVLDHKTHDVVSLREEYEEKKAELVKIETETHQMIQERLLKIQEIKRSVNFILQNADREIAEGIQVFTFLMQSVERGLNELIDAIIENKKATEKQAKTFIEELEQEISELMKRRAEVEQLSHTEDHLHLLQSVEFLNDTPPTKDWTEIRVRPSSYEGTVVRAVSQLEETLSKEMKKLVEAELKRVQQYAVNVTLDPDSAHHELILSEDDKQVNHVDVRKNLPDNPGRFSTSLCVLGKQSFSSGKFYYEVQVKGKTGWDLGVARESIERKRLITLSPEDGYWTIWLRNGNEYQALDDPDVSLSLKSQPQKVGVFVDYEEGLVSFYDVGAAAVIYSFTGCSFTEKLYPYFNPGFNDDGKNSAPLIINDTNQLKLKDMAAANCLLSEDQFLCSICLDVFTDPVTTPCGHNFCKDCITQHWNVNVPWKCPMCKEGFKTRPELHINTFISEMVAQFKEKAQEEASNSSPEQQDAKPGEVSCDVCTGTKLKALKSCLVCLVSYCETHLEPHLTTSGLRRHQLIDPVENLEGRMCVKHNKPLELFCKTDQTCVCMLCPVLDHKTHEVVPLKEEYEEKKAELGETETEIQQMIQKRQLKIQEIKQLANLNKENAEKEIENGVQVFTNLMQCVERGLNEVIETIVEKQRSADKQAEDFIIELEQEISDLKTRRAEVEQLSLSEDHLHLLQCFPSLKAAPPTKDWTAVSVQPLLYGGTVVRAVSQLDETLSKEMMKVVEAELRRIQQYAVVVTLDPDTAHPNLNLSRDGKQVNHGDVKKNLPDNPDRFSNSLCVLAKQSFSSGRFYYEVQVKGKTKWTLGVARESINRKENIPLSPGDGYWTICLRNENEYKALADPDVYLFLKWRPQRVGVFVDYEEGLVSFYDVGAAALMYCFTGCSFTEKLYLYFGPCPNDGGKNSTPLIITPINRST